ncbi:RING finger domain-containing protein [Candidatus Sororendozoicomonas aggregata]|uniref:RING finger domain-containing protein n=1 Tax=Candidatus Sororendozoicomonas aggregata TaxID=3073239 RepID=UPI002ED22299
MPIEHQSPTEHIEQQPAIARLLSCVRGHAPLHQGNAHYPEIKETDLPDGEVCCICLDNFAEGNSVAKLNECQHMFHENCMLQLLGIPDGYLDPSQAHTLRLLSYNIHNIFPTRFFGFFQRFFHPDIYLNQRNVKLSDSDIALLHRPEHPGFLADYMYNINHYSSSSSSTGEWYTFQGGRPSCPMCRNEFTVGGSYTLYRISK